MNTTPNAWPLRQLMRPATLPVTAVACLLGIAIAAACGHGPRPLSAIATVVLACLAHAAGNALCASHGDVTPTPDPATARQARELAVALGFFAAGFGLLLAVKSTGYVILFGAAGLLLAWAYAAAPLRLAQRGLGTLVAAVVWSLVVIGADAVQRGTVFIIPVVTSVSYALLVACLHLATAFDTTQDAPAGGGPRTVRRLGRHGTALLYLLLSTAAHLWLAGGVALLYQPEPARWGLISWPVSLAAGILFWRPRRPSATQPPAIALSGLALLLHGVAMAAGFWSLRAV